jgi:hypothetical protein
MAETTTTTFRFPAAFHNMLGLMANWVKASRTEFIQKSVILTAELLNDASLRAHTDLAELRERYGDDARILIGVLEEDGQPVAGVTINGEHVDDVHARPYVDEDAGEAHVFLEVVRWPPAEHAHFMPIGEEALFVAYPRFPVGALPWPPKPNLGIVIELDKVNWTSKAEPAPVELVKA